MDKQKQLYYNLTIMHLFGSFLWIHNAKPYQEKYLQAFFTAMFLKG